jgi:hypothetical protein
MGQQRLLPGRGQGNEAQRGNEGNEKKVKRGLAKGRGGH